MGVENEQVIVSGGLELLGISSSNFKGGHFIKEFGVKLSGQIMGGFRNQKDIGFSKALCA
jgi:hypothetical protein